MRKHLGYLFAFFIVFLSSTIYAFPEKISIIFSGEELGNLEPCGCYEGQLGGISRRHSFIDFFRKQGNIVLPVSLGDLSRGYSRQDEIKLETLCRAMGEMGYVLHNLGEKDIGFGPQILSFLSQTNKVNFLSSNVKIVSPFPIKISQYVIKERFYSGHSFKIAFFGILSKSLFSAHALDYVNVSEPVKALSPLVKQLHGKVDLLVLLSHSSLEESVEIAKFFPEIGLIISGHNSDEPEDAIYINNTPVVSPGMGGKYIGVAHYSINKNVVERKSVEVVPLDHTYKDSKEMISLLKEYQQQLVDEDLLSKTPQAPLPEGLFYVGSFACGVCHKVIYDHWYKTTHGASYNTLIGVGHQYDPECIKCHTTGYGDVSGFLNYQKNRNLIDVGCESCHGAGSKHIKSVKNDYGTTGESNCVICHNSEHSPKFQFAEYWKKIEHPKETPKKLPKTLE